MRIMRGMKRTTIILCSKVLLWVLLVVSAVAAGTIFWITCEILKRVFLHREGRPGRGPQPRWRVHLAAGRRRTA